MGVDKAGEVSVPKTPPAKINVVKAGEADIDTLVMITGICFPEQILWSNERLARRFWEAVMKTDASETWMWNVDDVPAAFSHIIIDLEQWAKEKKAQEYGLLTKMKSVAKNPSILLEKIATKRKGRDKDQSYTHPTDSRMGEELTTWIRSDVNGDMSNFRYGGMYLNPENVVWVERAGILPDYRNFGLSMHLMRHSEKIARELKRSAICGVIQSHNKAWCLLHERFGYQAIQTGPGKYTFIKRLMS